MKLIWPPPRSFPRPPRRPRGSWGSPSAPPRRASQGHRTPQTPDSQCHLHGVPKKRYYPKWKFKKGHPLLIDFTQINFITLYSLIRHKTIINKSLATCTSSTKKSKQINKTTFSRAFRLRSGGCRSKVVGWCPSCYKSRNSYYNLLRHHEPPSRVLLRVSDSELWSQNFPLSSPTRSPSVWTSLQTCGKSCSSPPCTCCTTSPTRPCVVVRNSLSSTGRRGGGGHI